MTLTTATPGKASKSLERRKIEGEFPELADKMHLPKFGRVEAISDRANAGQLNDPFRPRYAVDVQLLGEDGQPDQAAPLYRAVPLPVQFGGQEQGLLQFPLEGTLVELGFAFGRADRPFIRTVIGSGWPLPDIARASNCSSNGPRYSAAPTPWAISPATPTGACMTVPCRCTTKVTTTWGNMASVGCRWPSTA